MAERQNNESQIFHDATELSPDEREDFLEKACGDDSDLKKRIQALLRAHDDPDSYLRNPAEELNEQPLGQTHVFSQIGIGQQIGPYKLLQEIGEGGMGIVYMAQQIEPVKRRVALKIIKPGMDSREVIARFEAERQALALLDHPNIAKVLDGGTTDDGRPYFVMELVKGASTGLATVARRWSSLAKQTTLWRA